MKAIWQRIEFWLEANAPMVFRSLRRGATEDEILSAEAFYGCTFPKDYRESLMCHDGQELGIAGSSPGFLYGLGLFPLTKTLSNKSMIEDLLQTGLGTNLEIETYGPVKAV